MTSDPRFDAQFALGYESKRSAWWMQDRRTISELDPDPLAGGDGRSSRGTTVAPATTVAGRAAGAVSYTTRFHHQHDPMAVQASRSDPVGRPTPGDEGRGLRGGNPRSLMVQERITREEAERRRAQELLASMGRGGVSTITPVGGTSRRAVTSAGQGYGRDVDQDQDLSLVRRTHQHRDALEETRRLSRSRLDDRDVRERRGGSERNRGEKRDRERRGNREKRDRTERDNRVGKRRRGEDE